jgi:chemotaxis signal transduction protein
MMQTNWQLNELAILAVCDRRVGVDAGQVQEIFTFRAADVVHKPTPPQPFGLVRSQRRVLPTFWLQHQLQFLDSPEWPSQQSPYTCITFEGRHMLVGCVVEAVEQVLPVSLKRLKPAPGLLARVVRQQCVWGFYDLAGALIPLLDLERLIPADQLRAAARALAQ